jgi:hypothetical protein
MGETIKGAPHVPWVNRWAVTALAVASAWAFGTNFGRELARFSEGAESSAKVVVMAPAAPEPGMAPLRTYAVAAPARPIPRAKPLLLDIPALASDQASTGSAAPTAGSAAVAASATAPDSAPPSQAQPAPHEDPG